MRRNFDSTGCADTGGDQDRELISLPLRGPPGAAIRYTTTEPEIVTEGPLSAADPLFGWQALLYLYRPAELRRDLRDAQAAQLLRQAGYGEESCARCVARLVCRFRESGEFPHEVGLFLSYPPEDVKGFIDHRACGFKCAGLWKVYGDEEKARTLFAKYRKCTEIYCALWQSGSRLEQLAVAV